MIDWNRWIREHTASGGCIVLFQKPDGTPVAMLTDDLMLELESAEADGPDATPEDAYRALDRKINARKGDEYQRMQQYIRDQEHMRGEARVF